MKENSVSFRTGAVKPVECFRIGWDMIRDQYWLFLGITLVGVLISMLAPFYILMGPMMCGIYMCMLCRHRGGNPSFELLFKGFDHFLESFVATIVIVIPIFIVSMVVYAVIMVGTIIVSETSGTPGVLFVLFVIAVVAVMFLVILFVRLIFFFCYTLIADRGLKSIDAVKTSARAVWGNLGGLIGLLLLNMLLNLAGMLCCCIGVVLVIPIGFAAITEAYLQIFGDEAQAESTRGSIQEIPPTVQ